ncbi:heat-inducible transcriptional repressor HrcA [Georgenia sp. Z1344]|uniref:heat-inducible transcriptional repressor HrcA n=1 Tax=Georgenia sp. Z1344 TaxID=3416706 RepID=UPI003CE9376D
MSTEDRRLRVLQAIVSDFVRTSEPVASRALVERHHLDVSPATIRNDMAALEESGHIAQPHTSAGRVPTEKGYRAFVDEIATLKPLSGAERAAIETLLGRSVDLDDVVERTVRLLAQLTNNVAVVQYPSLSRTSLRHLELVPLDGRRLLIVIITSAGRVEQRTVEVPPESDPVDIAELGARLNLVCAGLPAPSIGPALVDLADRLEPSRRPLLDVVASELTRVLAADSEERIVLGGTANLARAGTDFSRTIGPVLEALEEQVVLLRLFAEMEADRITVRIGSENHHDSLSEASIVAGAYGASGEVVARVGVLGPTRMDYPGTMAAVRAVARYLSRFLGG